MAGPVAEPPAVALALPSGPLGPARRGGPADTLLDRASRG
jgi:hypothetical protein